MTIEWLDVLDIAPELSTLPVSAQDALIADAYLLLSEGVNGDRLDTCAKYLCAHMATLNKRKGLGGAITGQSVGQVSRQFASPATAWLSLADTGYGNTLLMLFRTNAAARWVVA